MELYICLNNVSNINVYCYCQLMFGHELKRPGSEITPPPVSSVNLKNVSRPNMQLLLCSDDSGYRQHIYFKPGEYRQSVRIYRLKSLA